MTVTKATLDRIGEMRDAEAKLWDATDFADRAVHAGRRDALDSVLWMLKDEIAVEEGASSAKVDGPACVYILMTSRGDIGNVYTTLASAQAACQVEEWKHVVALAQWEGNDLGRGIAWTIQVWTLQP